MLVDTGYSGFEGPRSRTETPSDVSTTDRSVGEILWVKMYARPAPRAARPSTLSSRRSVLIVCIAMSAGSNCTRTWQPGGVFPPRIERRETALVDVQQMSWQNRVHFLAMAARVDAAYPRPASERDAFLDEARAGDAMLRQEVLRRSGARNPTTLPRLVSAIIPQLIHP